MPASLSESSARTIQRAALLSIFAGALISLIKFAAFVITDSAAIFSDAVESINNVLAASVAAYAVYQSARAPDREHPFGRGRWEYFSAGFEGGLIILAALAILYEAAPRLLGGEALRQLRLGLALTAAASLANAVLGWYLQRTGRRLNSEALVADGKHVFSDVITSLGVLLGVGGVVLSGWQWLDPLVACAMALWILISGVRIVQSSFHRLLDRVRPETLQAAVAALHAARRDAMIFPHRLRLRESGPRLEINFHLITPRFYTIEELHRLESAIDHDLQTSLDRPLDLLMHSDPCSPLHCTICRVQGCPLRREAATGDLHWDASSLTGDGHLALAPESRSIPAGSE
ncbi:MAG: cation diffusion facilitator family transporter [Leptospirales bacterium]|nr:cation diffusion facilitator family transporter [Leptospirales bacterium]